MTAPGRRGRPSRGTRVELKLDTAPMEGVTFLTRTEGPDRSAVLARLVRAGLEAWDLVVRDVVAIRAWAETWPTCCGVELLRGGRVARVEHADDSGALVETHLETLDPGTSQAARRLQAVAPLVIALEMGHLDGYQGNLVIRCTPESAERDAS